MSENDTVNRYKILFHDASSSKIEQLIRKLIQEIKRKYDDDVFAIKVMEYERGLRDAKPKVSREWHRYDIDSYKAGILWTRAVVEPARRLKKGTIHIVKRIDERADEIDAEAGMEVK